MTFAALWLCARLLAHLLAHDTRSPLGPLPRLVRVDGPHLARGLW